MTDAKGEDGKSKILLVDDRAENLIALETILQDERYTLITASSGREALSYLLKDQEVHLIIMDVLMPVMNGFETATLIYQREKLKNIPIIFLTAMDVEGNIYKGYKAGAIDYIRKPVIPELLRVKVRAFVELSEKNRELIRQEQRLQMINQQLEQEIAERKLSEQKVTSLAEDLARKLEQLQSLDSFNYSVSHDLMSPLNSIIGLTALLQDMHPQQIGDEVLTVVKHINGAADKMSRLIQDLLSFSRQANADLAVGEFSMREVIDEVLTDIRLNLPVEKTEIIVHEVPRAKGDNKMVKQVWSNLISNAIKYSQKKEKPRVEIGSKTDFSGPVYFVKDNGAGFNMKNYHKLFGIFQRLHSEKDFTGTGVGLAVVKRIIDKHNGKIWAESTLGDGASFYFTLNS